MVEVKLGRGALLLGAILAVGYIIIFISIMIDPGAGPKFNMMQTELAELQLKLDRKIAAEKNALHGNARGAVVVGNDVRASRPGVIILGMHRSGMFTLITECICDERQLTKSDRKRDRACVLVLEIGTANVLPFLRVRFQSC